MLFRAILYRDTQHMKLYNDILNLITGNIEIEDKKKLFSIINADSETKEIYKKTKTSWAILSSEKKVEQSKIDRFYLDLEKRIQPQKSFSNFKISRIKYAAILILCIGLASVLNLLFNGQDDCKTDSELRYLTVVAENSQISKVILPDSSIVWLNSGTTLQYNNNYSVDNRDLILLGQAYLDVKKDANNPLVVICEDLNVKVYGTTFDVCAYPGDDNFKVMLETGSVELSHPRNESISYKLRPGETAQFDVTTQDVKIRETGGTNIAEWKKGHLDFKDAPMNEVIRALENKFDVEITVQNPEVYKPIVSAYFFKDESLSDVLTAIESFAEISSEFIDENNVTLYTN